MAYSESRRNITNRYRGKYSMIQVRVEQAEKDLIAQHAKERGESVNKFIIRAIKDTIERDNSAQHQETRIRENNVENKETL